MKRRNSTYQRGVALLMALGFLSLLLVMGIAFVTNATVARKSAANFRARTQAKSIADSAVNRLMASIAVSVYDKIQNGSAGDYTQPADMVSLKNADDTDESVILAKENSLLTTIIYGEKFIPRSVKPPKWEYWYSAYKQDGTSKPTEDARIIGRTAFMALSQTAIVNFSEVMRGCTETSSGAVSEDNKSWSNWNARRGASMRELCIEKPNEKLFNRFKDEEFDKDNTGRPDKQDFAVDKNTTEKTTDFQSYDDIFTAQEIAVLGTDNDDTKTEKLKKQNIIRTWLLPSGYNEPEIYAFNQNSSIQDRYSEMTNFYHRFDLSRIVGTTGLTSIWDTSDTTERVTVDSLLGLPERFKQKEKNHKVTRAIPYLKTIIGGGRSAFSPENLRKQVAANLIDYCDTDSIATSDSTDWENNAPKFTGNDKTPYINEIMIGPSVGITRTETTETPAGGTPTYTYTYGATIDLRMIAVELINMYENSFPDSAMSIKGECDLEITPDDQAKQTVKVTFDLPMSAVTACDATNNHYGYKLLYTEGAGGSGVTATGWSNVTTAASETQRTDPVKVTVKVTNLKIEKVHLKTADGSVDYVRDLEFAATEEATITSTESGESQTVTAYPHVGCEVDDPRENLYQGSTTDEALMNWRLINVAAVATDKDGAAVNSNTLPEKVAGTEFTFNGQNAFCNPQNSGATAAKDLETATEPENISTAYIANKPMQSLAELGAIHRAAKWQTLNLRKSATRIWDAKYDPERDDLTSTEGYTYEDGDAAILDQVKLTPLVFSAGKVNLNIYPESNNFLFKALFRNILWEVDHHAKYEGAGGRIDDVRANSLCTTLGGSKVDSRGYFLSRGHFIDYMNAHSAGNFSAIGNTDAQNEIIPAVSAGLTSTYTTSPSVIQYILVAQSIRDVGTKDGIDMERVNKDGSDIVTKNVKSGVFDYENGIYFDEITGETKMLVTIQIDEANGKIRLLKKEYID